MPAENVRRRKTKRRYSFILFPSDDATHSRTFTLSRIGILIAGIAALASVIALTFAIIVYTPIGRWLPIPHPELELTYGRQIGQIQGQLMLLVREVVSLRAYNIRLRRAMGENISLSDSTFMLEHPEAVSSGSERQWSASHASEGGGEDTGNGFIEPTQQEFTADREENVPSIMEDLPMALPLHGYSTRQFEPGKNHFGIDIAAKEGTPVFAAAGGRVIFANWSFDDGYEIIISHEKGFMTVYKHNMQLMKSAGDEVKRDELIALSGNTGETSSGPHLHFEVWKDGAAKDPMDYLLTTE
jgi:murein DD-endopeptidase MepM/ murein hydrolase activator NlpD